MRVGWVLPRRSPWHNARHCWTLDHITSILRIICGLSANHKPFQGAGGHCQFVIDGTRPPSTTELYVQREERLRVPPPQHTPLPWRTQRRPSVILAHTRFTSSFSLCPFSLSSPLLNSLVCQDSHGSLSRTCDTASFSELARATGLARNLPLSAGAGAAEFVCEFVFIRDTAARAHKCVPGTVRGPVSVAVFLMFGRAFVCNT